ncbi:hypothetical protein ACHAWF_010365 [Thalassiosira exigua]
MAKKSSEGQAVPAASDGAKPEKPRSEKRSRKDGSRKKQRVDRSSSNSKAAAELQASNAANLAADPNVNGDDGYENGDKKAAKKRAPPPKLRLGRAPRLDPLRIARGVSARHLPSRTARELLPISREVVDRDLRHMEAYRVACAGYAQQLFAYENRELVRSGRFSSAPGTDEGVAADGRRVDAPTSRPRGPAGPKGRPVLPSRIDPDEERRLSLLRKRMHKNEFERERLETEYLSLRAHYVHESQLLRKARAYELGRWRVMRDVATRRGRALGLSRARLAIARDAEWIARRKKASAGVSGDVEMKDASTPTQTLNRDKEGTADAPAASAGGEGKKNVAATSVKKAGANGELVKVWDDLHAQLKEAEMACANVETPGVLAQMAAACLDLPNGGRSRSPTRDGDRGGKSPTPGDPSNNGSKGGGGGKKGRSSTPSSSAGAPDVVPWDCVVEPRTPYGLPLLLSCLSSTTDKVVGFVTDRSNPTAITWLESNLPESTAAFAADAKDVARLREEVRGLEEELAKEGASNAELQNQIIASRKRSDQMVAMMQLLRAETEAVLERYVVDCIDLSFSDCGVFGNMRERETTTLIYTPPVTTYTSSSSSARRHNLIMETPEARAKSAELHSRLLAEDNGNTPSGEGEDEDEEGEIDGEEDLSSVEEEIQARSTNDRRTLPPEDDDEEEGSDDGSVGIKEITVDNEGDNGAAGEEDESEVEDDEEEGSEEGEIAEEEDEEEGEIAEEEGDEEDGDRRRSKRHSSAADGDEESSSTPPPGPSSHRKRRRF